MSNDELVGLAEILIYQLEQGDRGKAAATCRDILIQLKPAAEALVRQCGIIDDEGVSCGELGIAEIFPPQLGSPFICRDHLPQARALGWDLRILPDL